MRARLAFGACLAIDFDVYLIDEVTEIGDERFRRKCAAAFRERLRRSDIILATHNHHTIRQYCDRARGPGRRPAAVVRQRRGRVRTLPRHADEAGVMPPPASGRVRQPGSAVRRPSNPATVATAAPARSGPASACAAGAATGAGVGAPSRWRRRSAAGIRAGCRRACCPLSRSSLFRPRSRPSIFFAVGERPVRRRVPLHAQQRRGAAPRPGRRCSTGHAAPSPPAALESQILVQYIASRAMVDEVDAALDLRRLFSPPQADWWARLPLPATIEELVRYWKGQVDPFYDPANGTVTVRVRAFDPADALRLAEAVVAACEALVNELSLRARHDALAHAECRAGAGRRPAQGGARADPRLPRSRGADRSGADRRSERRCWRPGCATSWSRRTPSSRS